MRITIDGGASEIAALVLAVQERGSSRRLTTVQEQIKETLGKQLQLFPERPEQCCFFKIDGKEFSKLFIPHQGNHD